MNIEQYRKERRNLPNLIDWAVSIFIVHLGFVLSQISAQGL